MPFILSEHGLGLARRNARLTATRKGKAPFRLELPRDVTELTAFLGERSRGIYLLGGPAIAAAAGVELPYVNLLMDSKSLSEVKRSLFEFGVTPVSTADLPGNFIRFMHRGRAYNVLNLGFDTYAQLSAAGMEKGLILFAHNFLMYSASDQWVLDPYGALECKSGDKTGFLIKPLRQPGTLLQGFEHCLAATFDYALLGLRSSPAYEQMEQRLFHSTPNAKESNQILSELLDYASDLLEVGGLRTACRLLLAPVCVAAAQKAAELDLLRVEARLQRLHRQGTEITGREFMAAIHTELLKKPHGKGAAQGLPEYLIAARNPFRRVEVLIDAVESTPAEVRKLS